MYALNRVCVQCELIETRGRSRNHTAVYHLRFIRYSNVAPRAQQHICCRCASADAAVQRSAALPQRTAKRKRYARRAGRAPIGGTHALQCGAQPRRLHATKQMHSINKADKVRRAFSFGLGSAEDACVAAVVVVVVG